MVNKVIRERDIEKYLCDLVKNAGGETRKLKWIGRNNAPDRVVFLNAAVFVEVKAPGEEPTAAQTREHNRMNRQGAHVCCVSTFDEVERLVYYLKRKLPL